MRIFDYYRIVRMLGRGSSSVVYAGFEKVTKRRVAIKMLGRDSWPRFFRETNALARLDHPAVTKLHDFDIDRDSARLYLVLEHVEGVTLLDRLRRDGAVGERCAALWMMRIAEALEHVHARRIVHRDLKPTNVMFYGPRADHVKLLDFGIALDLRSDAQSTDDLFGTPGFISPEQASGDPVDERTDLYALGCLLYAALSARAPYAGLALEAQAREPPPPLPERLANGSAPSKLLTELYAGLLAKSPADRPRRAGEVKALLGAVATQA